MLERAHFFVYLLEHARHDLILVCLSNGAAKSSSRRKILAASYPFAKIFFFDEDVAWVDNKDSRTSAVAVSLKRVS